MGSWYSAEPEFRKTLDDGPAGIVAYKAAWLDAGAGEFCDDVHPLTEVPFKYTCDMVDTWVTLDETE